MAEATLVLPAELTIAQVDEFKTHVMALVEDKEVVRIDDSQVTRIDTIGVQMLLAIVTHISSQKQTILWQSSSTIIKQSVKQLGLNESMLSQYLN